MDTISCIKHALHEDIQDGDITSILLLTESRHVSAKLIAKETGVFFGNSIIEGFKTLYPNLLFSDQISDGMFVKKGDCCLVLSGDIRDIVTLERTLLNFLQRLSGIASITRQFVDALDDPSIQVLDTRKTTPLFRTLEKAAVVAGGGFNHRFGLYDMVLVKENHLISYIQEFGVDQFNQRLHDHKQGQPTILVEVEVNDLTLLHEIDLNYIDIIMFDNMSITDLENAINHVNKSEHQPLKEVSGNICLNTISRYRGIDIDRISVGSLTHSVKALDLSLLVQ